MKAVRFHFSKPRYAAGMLLGKLSPQFYWNGISCTRLDEVDEPALPGPDWVKVRTRLGGICGTDLSTVRLDVSPYYSPFSSFPFTLGHEAVGVVAETGSAVTGLAVGERVVLEPVLWCRPRGFADLCPNCAAGRINLCERSVGAPLADGLLTGSSALTGGSWSSTFVAHCAQLYRVPDRVSDENALLVEPFATGLHAVLPALPQAGDRVLVIGAGTIGLAVLAALRTLGSPAQVIVLARHAFQAEAARRLGADVVIQARGDFYSQVLEHTGGQVHKAVLGKPAVTGGVDHTFVCSGSDAAVDDALRLTRSAGRVVLVSAPGIARRIDWSPFLVKELEVRACYAYTHAEHWQDRVFATFDLALSALEQGQVDLGWMVTHTFPVEQYQAALALLGDRHGSQAIKVAFAFPPKS